VEYGVAGGAIGELMGLTGGWGRGETGRQRVRAVLRDPQFWVPVLVLLLGLAVLRWIR
jgi:hypothetical protein